MWITKRHIKEGLIFRIIDQYYKQSLIVKIFMNL